MGACEGKKKKQEIYKIDENQKLQQDLIDSKIQKKKLEWKLTLTREQLKIMDVIQNLSKIVLNQGDFIGKGSYGQVYHYEILNTPLAVKFFSNEEEAVQEKEAIESIQAIASNCPGIIKYYGMKKLEIEITGILTQNYSGYAIFLEECTLDLERFQGLSKTEILNFLSQISLSLFCLHSNGFFHGNINPANILINKNNSQQINYYLTDYGQGKCLEELITTNYQTLYFRETPYYFCPELWDIFNQKANIAKYNPLAADIYALGIICLEFLLGQSFVQTLNMFRTQEQQYNNQLQIIKNELLKTIGEFKQNPNNELLLTLINMVSFHQKERPQAIEVCQALISSHLFSMDALETATMKALIVQLISSFRPIAKTNVLKDSINYITQMAQIPKNLQSIKMPTFKSSIIKDSAYSTLILSLFDNSRVNLSRLHYQQIQKKEQFNLQDFHQQCDKKGSTLVILKSNDEPNSLFGGMAVPEWESKDGDFSSDPADQCSWLFKIELKGQQVNLHQWKCIKKSCAIYCSKDYGPFFGEYGLYEGYLRVWKGNAISKLPSNLFQEYYQKQEVQNKENLLFQLQKQMDITCPAKVIGKIMNEEYNCSSLNQCEVFEIKQ